MRGWRETEKEFRRDRDRRVKPTLPKLAFMEKPLCEDEDTRFSELENSPPTK